MKLSVSTFSKGRAQNSQRLADTEMILNEAKGCFEGDSGEFKITGERSMRVTAVCTEPQRYFSIVVLQNGESIFNLAGSLENYANAMLKLQSGSYLSIHIERNPVQPK